MNGWLKSMLFSSLTLPEIEKIVRRDIRGRLWRIAYRTGLVCLMAGIMIGYAFRTVQMRDFNLAVEAQVKKLQTDKADLVDRLADKEGKRETEKKKGGGTVR